MDRKNHGTIETRLQDILDGNDRTTTESQDISTMEEAPMMENKTTPSGDEAKDTGNDSHICRAIAQSLRRHFTTHCKNLKAEVKELKTKDLQDLVTNEVGQVAEDKKEYVKEVIYGVLRSPTIMSEMYLVMIENGEVLGKFAQYAKRLGEKAVDNYIAKIAEKDRVPLDTITARL